MIEVIKEARWLMVLSIRILAFFAGICIIMFAENPEHKLWGLLYLILSIK